MINRNHKKITVLLFLISFVIFGISAYTPSSTGNYASGRDTTKFKNLQVLPKNISEDSLDNVMHNFSQSLGVRCTFCHVHNGNDFKEGWDFPSDAKPEKNTARFMMKMTAGINSTYFNFNNSAQPDTIRVVGCVTCHRGLPHPDADAISEQMKKINPQPQMPPPGKNPPPPPPANPPQKQ